MTEDAQAQPVAQPIEPQDFRSSLPEDIRDEPVFNSIKDLGSLAKSYVNAQRLIGQDKLVLPKGEDDVDGWNTVFNKLGRPTAPTEYEYGQVEPIDIVPKEYVEKSVAQFSEWAHEAGLNKKQAKLIFTKFMENQRAEAEGIKQSFQTQAQASEEALRQEWGSEFENNIRLANDAVLKVGGQELVNTLGSRGLHTDPTVIKVFSNLGKILAEDNTIAPTVRSDVSPVTPSQAAQKLNILKNDPEYGKILMNVAHPKHKEALAEWHRLQDLRAS